MSDLKPTKLSEKTAENKVELRAPAPSECESVVGGFALPSVAAAPPGLAGESSNQAAIRLCKSCGKNKREGRKGTMTAWIFADTYCRCTEQAAPLYQKTENTGPAAPSSTSNSPSQTPSPQGVSSQNAYAAAPPGLDVGLPPNYEIVSILGQGGMGTVYKVFDKALKTVFAIKVLRPELCQDAATIKRFLLEVSTVSKLSHPNLAAVYDQGVTVSGAPYLVMGYIEGFNLDQILRQQTKLHPADAVRLFIQLCDSVQYAHEHGVIHRDLKPSNIIISKGEPHIVDFGIAKVLTASHGRETQNLTATGEIFGSPSYMSPEQCMGYDLEARSDIYSLGCVMYEAMTGHPPFQAANPIQVIVQHLSEAPAPMFSKVGSLNELSKGLELIVMKTLEKNPADRYASMQSLKSDLESLQKGKKISLKRPKEEPLLSQSATLKIVVVILINAFALMTMLGQYDTATTERMTAKSLISEANALSKLFYDAGVACGGYSITKSPLFAERYKKIIAQMPDDVTELKRLAGDGKGHQQTIKELTVTTETGVTILNEAMAAIDDNKVDVEQFRARHMYKEIRKLADHLQEELGSLTKQASVVANDGSFLLKVKLLIMLQIFLLFTGDILFTIWLMKLIQRAARNRLWRIKD